MYICSSYDTGKTLQIVREIREHVVTEIVRTLIVLYNASSVEELTPL